MPTADDVKEAVLGRSTNLYVAFGNDPMKNIDPTGQDPNRKIKVKGVEKTAKMIGVRWGKILYQDAKDPKIYYLKDLKDPDNPEKDETLTETELRDKEREFRKKQKGEPEKKPPVPKLKIIRRIDFKPEPTVPKETVMQLKEWLDAVWQPKDKKGVRPLKRVEEYKGNKYGAVVFMPQCQVQKYKSLPGDKLVLTPDRVDIEIKHVIGFAHYNNLKFAKFLSEHEKKHVNVLKKTMNDLQFQKAFWEAVKKADLQRKNKGHLWVREGEIPENVREKLLTGVDPDTLKGMSTQLTNGLRMEFLENAKYKAAQLQIDIDDEKKLNEWLTKIFGPMGG